MSRADFFDWLGLALIAALAAWAMWLCAIREGVFR